MNIPHIEAAVAASIFSQRLITAGWTHIVSATGYKKFASENHNASAVLVRAMGSGTQRIASWEGIQHALECVPLLATTDMVRVLVDRPEVVAAAAFVYLHQT